MPKAAPMTPNELDKLTTQIANAVTAQARMLPAALGQIFGPGNPTADEVKHEAARLFLANLKDAGIDLVALTKPAAPVAAAPMTQDEIDAIKALMEKATKGPWEFDTTHNEGCYGSGEDVSEGFDSYQLGVFDSTGKWQALFDSLNSDAICVEVEYGDEDGGGAAWDEVARKNAQFIVAAINALPRLLTLAQSAATARREALEEIAEWAKPKRDRPCLCNGYDCNCYNTGDAADVSQWVEENAMYQHLRALIDQEQKP